MSAKDETINNLTKTISKLLERIDGLTEENKHLQATNEKNKQKIIQELLKKNEEICELKQTIQKMNRAANNGIVTPEKAEEAFKDYFEANKQSNKAKIEVIKDIRFITGWNLTECKERVDKQLNIVY